MSHTPAFYTCDYCENTAIEPLMCDESVGALPEGWAEDASGFHECPECLADDEEAP